MTAETLERAVTIHQPYAWAVAAGHKPVENRTWRPSLEAVGKLIGIHAGLGPKLEHPSATMERWVSVAAPLDVAIPNDLPTGALIGVARLVGVVRYSTRPTHHHDLELQRGNGPIWDLLSRDESERAKPWVKPHHVLWYFREAVLLPEPIPMRGQQGLWRIRGWNTDGGSGEFLDEDYPGQVAGWALEQWRKARETR